MDSSQPASPARLPVLRWWWVALAAVAVVILTSVAMWLLLGLVTANTDTAQAATVLDSVRTAFGVGLGAGGAFALWLAARRQRSTELQIVENSRIANDTKNHQERVALNAEFDATERRLTEIYSTSVEQLGSDKAVVRLGGLYSLERLAQENPSHRQSIVNVICAYLRMPYEVSNLHLLKLPPRLEAEHQPPAITEEDRVELEELQVRTTAQKILQDHLRRPSEPGQEARADVHWKSIDINLRQANLFSFELADCDVRQADFAHCRFIGGAKFSGTRFQDRPWFFEATFTGTATFRESEFRKGSVFTRCLFACGLHADNSTHHGDAYFLGATFGSTAHFSDAVFGAGMDFSEVQLSKDHYEAFGLSRQDWKEPCFDFSNSVVEPSEQNPTRELPPGWITDTDTGKIVPAAAESS